MIFEKNSPAHHPLTFARLPGLIIAIEIICASTGSV